MTGLGQEPRRKTGGHLTRQKPLKVRPKWPNLTWPCENPERTSTEGNRVLPALRVPSRLTPGRANIAQEGKIVLRVLSAPAFSHGQDPKGPCSAWWPIAPMLKMEAPARRRGHES